MLAHIRGSRFAVRSRRRRGGEGEHGVRLPVLEWQTEAGRRGVRAHGSRRRCQVRRRHRSGEIRSECTPRPSGCGFTTGPTRAGPVEDVAGDGAADCMPRSSADLTPESEGQGEIPAGWESDRGFGRLGSASTLLRDRSAGSGYEGERLGRSSSMDEMVHFQAAVPSTFAGA